MASSTACLLLLALLPAVSGKAFLGADPELQAKLVRQELQGVLAEFLGHGHDVDMGRLSKIRTSLAPIFQSLPKNGEGRLSIALMRYSVQRYFSHHYGWIVKGFEPHAIAANISDANEHILQSKLPDYVRTAFEEKFSHSGFALDDLVGMIAAVERLTFDEAMHGVELAFKLNNQKVSDGLNSESFTKVLRSFLLIEMFAGTINEPTKEEHAEDIRELTRMYPNWKYTFALAMDLAHSETLKKAHRRNPFVDENIFFFDDVANIGQHVLQQFSWWTSHECLSMKDALAKKDPHETGRVKLADFYKKVKGMGNFHESQDYLRTLGALDESSTAHGPQVIISNYIVGPNNCGITAAFFATCCLNECNKVFQHLEAVIPASTASAAEIIEAVEGMPDTSSIGAKNVSTSLRSRLEEVAKVNDGKVPLHGRLFAQWLHYVFPRDCPFPHKVGTVMPQTTWEFRARTAGPSSATDAEAAEHINSEAAWLNPSPDAGLHMWNLDEHILEASTPSDLGASSLRRLLRTVSSLAMLGGLVMMVFMQGLSPKFTLYGQKGKGKAVEYNV